MPARLLSIPFILLTLLLLYLSWEIAEDYALWLPAPVIMLSVIYVLAPQINWWYYRRHTPELEEVFRQLLLRRHPFYAKLSLQDKKRFRERVVLFRMATDYMPQGWEAVPLDVQTVLAIQAVSLTLGWPKFLLPPYEKVVVYPHPFPSPQYPRHMHRSELFEEDAVLLFSADALMRGGAEPQAYFNLGMYEYARVLLRVRAERGWPEATADLWDALDPLPAYRRERVSELMGLPAEELEGRAVAMVAALHEPAAIAERLPAFYRELKEALCLDPLEARLLKAADEAREGGQPEMA